MSTIEEIENLQLQRKELEASLEVRHKYNLWNKEIIDNEYIYTRNCLKCGHNEEIKSTSPQLNIENSIKKQIEAELLVNYFCQTEDKDLTNENILFYLSNTTIYQPYMDINKIVSKLKNSKKTYEQHDDIEERIIYNAILCLQKIGEIPEDLLNEINKMIPNIEQLYEEPKRRAT